MSKYIYKNYKDIHENILNIYIIDPVSKLLLLNDKWLVQPIKVEWTGDRRSATFTANDGTRVSHIIHEYRDYKNRKDNKGVTHNE